MISFLYSSADAIASSFGFRNFQDFIFLFEIRVAHFVGDNVAADDLSPLPDTGGEFAIYIQARSGEENGRKTFRSSETRNENCQLR